jgi:hypothetical protein
MADETTVEFDAPLMRANVEKLLARVSAALMPGLHAEAEALRSAADADVPVDQGELRASSFTDAQLTAHGNPAAVVGYDEQHTLHAGAVHEGFHFGTQRKTAHQFWLQTAANRFAPQFAVRMAERVRKVIG